MRAALLILVAASCSRDTIDVHRPGADYNRHALLVAIDQLNAAGRTPEAFARFAAEINVLRIGMDETVADEAELELDVLALNPIEQVHGLPPSDRANALATTVWSVAMASPITAPDPAMGEGDPGVPARPGETAQAYVERLCGGALAVDCMYVVPEAQAQVVEAIATRRMARRAKHAVDACEACAGDPQWKDAVAKWEGLEIQTHALAAASALTSSPDRWPTAGPGASDWTPAPVLEIADDGGWLLDGKPVKPDAKGSSLAPARGGAEVLDVRVLPGTRADVLAALIEAAGTAGFREVHVEARLETYPWRLRAYRFATTARGKKPPWRPVDTVQVLLRQVDARGEPGMLAHL